jgi:hypothetical protein
MSDFPAFFDPVEVIGARKGPQNRYIRALFLADVQGGGEVTAYPSGCSSQGFLWF